jgi:hypothetical protein
MCQEKAVEASESRCGGVAREADSRSDFGRLYISAGCDFQKLISADEA